MGRVVVGLAVLLLGCVTTSPQAESDPSGGIGALVRFQHRPQSGIGTPEPPQPPRTVPWTGSSGYFLHPSATRVSYGAAPSEIWPILISAFEGVGITPDYVDRPTWTAGAMTFDFSSWLGGLRGEPFLDCGTMANGRPLVDVAPLRANVVSRVIPSGESGSTVLTRFEGFALPSSGSWGTVKDCRSTGQLEEMIHDRLLVDAGPDSIPGAPAVDPYPWLPRVRDQVVRVTDNYGRRISGTLFDVRNHALLVRTSRLEQIPLPSVSHLEVRLHQTSRARSGALLGGVLGAVGGWASTALGGDHWKSQGRLLGPGIGLMAGGLVGALIGSKIGGPIWEPVPISPQTGPLGEGGVAGLRIGFRLPAPGGW
ncbi:hypothetical protein ACFL3S_07580 [Gemmatimonadota bacterium]